MYTTKIKFLILIFFLITKSSSHAIFISPEAKKHIDIGHIYLKMQDYKHAQINLKKSLDLGAKTYYIYLNLGVLAGLQGNYKEEIKFYQKSLNLNDRIAKTHLNLAVAYKTANYKPKKILV
ncbi:hypothetical protein MHK_000937, partial [Candidatus Magnetomorum sp. HK-1]